MLHYETLKQKNKLPGMLQMFGYGYKFYKFLGV